MQVIGIIGLIHQNQTPSIKSLSFKSTKGQISLLICLKVSNNTIFDCYTLEIYVEARGLPGWLIQTQGTTPAFRCLSPHELHLYSKRSLVTCGLSIIALLKAVCVNGTHAVP